MTEKEIEETFDQRTLVVSVEIRTSRKKPELCSVYCPYFRSGSWGYRPSRCELFQEDIDEKLMCERVEKCINTT